MNKTFHSVWNASKQAYVAAAETVSAKGKPTSGVKVAAVMAGLMGSLLGSVGHAQTAPPPSIPSTALPTSGQLSAGQASISQNGAHMVINQSTQRAAINWQTFNVGKDAHVQFLQPNAASVTLNRVMSSDPSQIFGRITANGQVILTNPAGVYFGKDARVDVGGLVATTMGLSDADFMVGNNRYQRNGSTGSVVNEGELKAALGGYIALLAPEVRNQGAIIAQMGTVALASGEAVDLRFDSNNRLTSLRVDPSQIQALVDNRHAVQAPDGLIIISALSMDRLIGGVVKNSGSLEANSLTAKGGRIVLEADHIELQSSSRIDASGATGGGTVLVGGDWQGGADPSSSTFPSSLRSEGEAIHQATTVTMAQDASIDASATTQGDGGKVVLWTDIHNAAAVTRVNGILEAKGGAKGGNGGQVETSGHQLDLGDTVKVDAGALHAQGKAGLWLLDPYSYNIGLTQATSIAASLNTTNVSIDTNTSNTTWGSNPSSVGYIDIFGNISKTGTAVTTLTLNATDKIDISGNIGTTGGALNLVLNSGDRNGLVTGKLTLGGGSLTKSGAGTISLLNVGNSYTGGTTVSGGVLGVYANTAVGTGTLTLGAGTTLRLGRAVSEIANNINLTGAATVDFDTAFDYLLVGGGGGGSFRVGAGGGGGGVTTGNVSSTASTYLSITVGAGGAGGTSTSTTGAAEAGSSSSLSMGATTLAAGGGEGGQGSVGVGGASGTPQSSAGGNGGFAGGDKYYGGGGGGAGQSLSGTYTRDGGDGLYVALTGLTYGGGGGGGGVQNYYNGGTGGTGGGGSGSAGSTGTAGTDGLGGGGGGGGISGPGGTGKNGGQGGSGTVVIRYLGSTATQATGGTATYASGYTYQTFTSTGTSTLDFNTVAKLSGTISGANNLTLNASGGQIKLSGTNTYSGGTTISGGTVKVGDAGTTGTLGTDNVVNNGSLYLNRTDNFTFANAISGYGSLSKMQNSVATLTGNNSYSGSTYINATGGTLQVGDGGTSGSLGTGSVSNYGVLTFNRSNDLTVSNNMSGTGGALTKLGNNTLTLTGTLTYSGANTISGGTLVLKNNAYPTSKIYNGSGALRIEPSSTSFSSAFSTSGWSLASTLSGLTLGQDGNTSAMTVANATSIAGPISIYGGDITLSADLTSTATAGTGVLLQGSKIKQNAGVDVTTGGSNISYSVLNSSWTSATEYGIQLAGSAAGSLATINANGGNVSLSAGFATTGTSGGTDKAIELDFASIRTSGSGTISITGDASNNGNSSSTNAWGIGFNTVTVNSTTLIQSESGAITLTGTAGKASSNARGMANDGTALRILSSSGAITLNDIQPAATTGSYLGLNLNPTSTAPIYIGADGSTVLSSSSNVTISADKATFAANNGNGTQINTSGTVTLQPYGNDFGSTLDTTNLALASTISGLTIGKSTTSADGTSDAAVTIGSATSVAGPVNVYGGNIAINAGLATTASLDSNAVITLKGSGNVTDGASGYVQAGNQTTLGQRTGSLLLLGGNVTLDNSASNDVYNLAASGVSGLTYLDYGGLKIYTVGSTSGVSATGVVNIGTKLYSLAVDKDITTTNASANALTLNASMDSAVGADLSSNILINSNASYTPTISVGAGGIGRLYTGGITTDSQRVSQLSGLTVGHFRYNADETTNFATAGLTALGTEINAIYRQQPTATVTVANKSMTYGDALPTLTGSVSGAVNGDSATYSISNRLNSTSGNIRVGNGTYTLTETGLTGLGYSVSATDGTLSVAKKALTLTGLLAADKTYDRLPTASLTSYGTLSGRMGSGASADAVTLDTSGVTAANKTFSDYNAGANKTVTVSGLSLTGSDAANYSIGSQTTTATIKQAPLTISGITAVSRAYDATDTATADGSALSLGGLIDGDAGAVTVTNITGKFDSKHVGTGKTVALGYTKGGAALGNYSVTDQTSTTADITKATLTLAGATGVSKTYDGTTSTANLVLNGTSTPASAVGDLSGILGTDTVTLTGSAVFASADVARSGNANTGTVTTQAINQGTIALAGADAGNYNLSWTPGTGTIHPAPLTVYANNDAKFVSTADPTFSVSYAGFVAGQTASALATTPTVTVNRTNALSVNGGGTRTLGTNGAELAGVYTDALVPGGAEAKNYSFNYVKGSYAIVPADQLLVRMAAVSTVYGTAASYAVSSAKYFGQTGAAKASVSSVGASGEITGVQVTTAANKFVVGDEVNVISATGTGTGARLRVDSITGNGSIATLSVVSAGSGYAASDELNLQYSREVSVTSAVVGNNITLTDMGGQTAQFNLAPTAAALSTAGKLKAGNYQLGADGLVTETSPNFSNVVTVVGNHTVTPKALTTSVTAGAAKTYDGTRAMVGLTLGLTGIETGTNNDVVNASGTGTYDVDKNASTSKAYTVTGITLGGTDAGNYYLWDGTTATSTLTGTGAIGKRTLNVTYTGVDKVYDGNSTAKVITSDDRVAGDKLTLAYQANFASMNSEVAKNVYRVAGVVTDKYINIASASLTGSDDDGNYTVAATGTATAAKITPASLVISGIVGMDKTYNNDATASLNTAGVTATGLMGSDTFGVTAAKTVQLNATGAFGDVNAGLGKAVTITSSYTGTDAGNYTITSQTGTTASIAKRQVMVTASNGVSKTYDGTTDMTGVTIGLGAVNGVTESGLVNGDSVDVSGTGSFSSASVSRDVNGTVLSDKTYTLSDLQLSGTNAANYMIAGGATSVTGNNGRIDPKTLTLMGFDAASKVYDGTTAATIISAGTLDGVVGADDVSASNTGATFSDKNVADGKTVTLNGIALVGLQAGNYSIAATATDTANITAKALTISGLSSSNKVYDGTTTVTVNGTAALQSFQVTGTGNSSDGIAYIGDVVSVTGTAIGNFNSKDVATANTVAFTGLSLTGGDAGNYTLTQHANDNAPRITAKALTISGLSSSNKVYDGTTNAAVSGTAAFASVAAGSGSTSDGKAYTGDAINLTGTAVGNFNSKDVATANTVAFTGLSLTGGDAGNYMLTQHANDNAPRITPKALTISGLSSSNKVYDGTTSAAVNGTAAFASEAAGSGSTSDGKAYIGDTVSLSGTALGNFNSKDVATANTVAFTGLSLTGSDADNYMLTQHSSDNLPRITAKALTISGLSSISKVYDGTTTATVNGTATLQSFQATSTGNSSDGIAYIGDVVSVTGTAIGNFNSKDVATANTVAFTGLSLTGGDAGNYTLTQHANDNALRITAKALTISGLSSSDKVYDGTTAATVSGTAVLQTFQAAGSGNSSDGAAYTGDAVSLSGTAVGNFNSKDVATANTVAFTGLSLTGGDAGNYQLTQHANDNVPRITPKALTISGLSSSDKVYDGTTAATVSGTAVLQTFQTAGYGTSSDGIAYIGDTVSLSGTPVGNFNSKSVASANTVAFTGLSLTGGDAGNYTLSQHADASQLITPKALTIAANAVTKIYDGAIGTAGTTATVDTSALVSGDVVNSAGTQAFNNKNVGTGKTVQASGVTIKDASNADMTGNYNITYVDDTTSTITQLASATWVGGATGDWFNPANWASTSNLSVTGAVPDLANVATVVIPAGHSVNFSALGSGLAESSQPVSITALQGSNATLNVSVGTLKVGSSGITLGGLAQTGGDIASAGSVTVGHAFSQSAGTLSSTGSGSHISLTQATGDLIWSSISSGGNLTADSAGKTSLGMTTVGGNLTSTTRGAGTQGGVVQTGALTVAGTAHFIADTGTGQDALLHHASNDFQGAVSFTNANSGSWRDVTLVDVNALMLGDISANGNLNATAATELTVSGTVNVQSLDLQAISGDITQGANGTLIVTQGPTNLQAGNDMTLGGANDFNGAVNVIGANDVTLNDTNGLILGDISASGKLDATAGTDLAINGTVNVQSLELQATTGDITQGANGTLTVSQGPTKLQAGDNITLDGANDFNGVVNAAGINITLADANALTAVLDASGNSTLTAGGSLTVSGRTADLTTTSGGTTSFGATTAAGDLTAASSSGITQTGALNVAGTADLSSTNGTITLSNPANDFGGTVNAEGANIALSDVNSLKLGAVKIPGDVLLASNGPLDLGTLTAGGTLTANSGNGNITQSGPVKAGGLANFKAGAGTVTLTQPGNSFPKGTQVQAAGYVIAGDARQSAAEAAQKVQGSLPTVSVAGTGLSNAAAPAPLVLASSTAAASTSGGSSSSSAAVTGGSNNSTGVVFDVQGVDQQASPAMVAVSLPKGASTSGTGFSFELPESVKSQIQGPASTQANLPNGAPLPAWLNFDAQGLRFEAKAVPDGAFPLQVALTIRGQRVMVVISERTE